MNKVLFKRDANQKIRVVYLKLNEFNDSEGTFFAITGETGTYNGKLVKRPLITIDKGKSTRTVKEQALLQYNSIIKSYLDKGYKTSSELNIIDTQDSAEVAEKVPKINTDTKGVRKPMLAKSINDVKKLSWADTWYCSRKLDGVRCFIYLKDNVIQTSSRGGGHYNVAAQHIITNPTIQQIFTMYPDIILDGELYIHGRPLSYISGLVRLETRDLRHNELEFHCYDIVEEGKLFKERYKILQTLSTNNVFKICEHVQLSSEKEINTLHDKWVQDGYEGLVMRHENNKYQCGVRSSTMLKIKRFTDDEFKILGLVEGLRDEDMCFLLETKEGFEFKAKPIGDRALKQFYRDNIKTIIGELGKVKYFGYTTTDKPVPNLPVFIAIRYKSDI